MLHISSKFLFIVFSLMISIPAVASRLYLMAGGGLNTTLYHPLGNPQLLGGGVNIKTDLGYNLTDHFAIEWESQVKFNQVKNVQVWDTLLTFGIRYAFPYTNHYLRASAGRSPTVFYVEDNPEVVRNSDATRLQLDGVVYGLGFGRYFKTKKNNIWFLEGGVTYQRLEKETAIKNDRDVPVEIYSRNVSRPILLYSVYTSIGMRVF